MSAAAKQVLVTGGNKGIGLALCKLLVTKFSCHVYLGSRDPAKGKAAVSGIVDAFPKAEGKIEYVTIDVGSDESCATVAQSLKTRGALLYAVVNNAGIGLKTAVGGCESILNTNYQGPKRVTKALAPLIDPKIGRIVNVCSGVAAMWLRDQNEATKAIFSNPELTFAELDAAVKKNIGNLKMGGYGLSKAALNALTLIQARTYPALQVVSLSPGFIQTSMTEGYGAKLSPEEGCRSSLKCLFGSVTSGHFYGSDGLRSPLTCTRDPGTPEYKGEENPDPAKYNK